MTRPSHKTSDKSKASNPWRVLLALLCIALVLVGGTVQVTHSHLDPTDSHADCSLCATAHLGVQETAPAVLAVAVRVESFLPAVLVARVFRPAVVFALFTRPPPLDRTFA